LYLGIATFEQTFPLSAFAALSKLSVPALYRTSPSLLNPRHLQLPSGCLRVRQAVSISPRPFSEAADDSRRALHPGSRTPPSWSFSSSESEVSTEVGAGGRRYCCTCPEDRPTARMGKFGWRACAKRSEDRGSVQIVSNIFCAIQSFRASGESKELEKNFFGQAKSLQGRHECTC